MKITILNHMKPNRLYSREELAVHSKRIDFELAHLLGNKQITKYYQGIYSKSESSIDDEQIIEKIVNTERSAEYLIVPARILSEIPKDLSTSDYICLNHKRSDLISTVNFKIKFQIPTHGFPRKLNDEFLTIYQANSSSVPKFIIQKFINDSKIPSRSLRGFARKYANKRTFSLITKITYTNEKLIKTSSELSSIGAPLFTSHTDITSSKIGPKENIIADALKIGMDEPRIHNIIPFTILRNAKEIDFRKLESLSRENGTYRYAGFVLDLLRRAGFENVPEFIAPKYHPTPKILFKSTYGKRGLIRLQSNHLDFALEKWGILIDSKVDTEREKIRKWL